MGEFWRLLGATLLGAMISFGTTFYFERRKERRAEHAEKQERDRQLRQAVRLVWDELIDIAAEIDTALDSGQWWASPPHDLPQTLWTAHRATLAALITSEPTWSNLAIAYSAVSTLNVKLQMGRDGKETFNEYEEAMREPLDSEWISESLAGDLRRANTVVRWGIEALRPIVRPSDD